MKMHPMTKEIYLNAIKTILTKQNWGIFRKKYKDDDMFIITTLYVFHHRFDRDKEKLNEWFERIEKKPEILRNIDRMIELTREKLEKLEKLKYAVMVKI